MDKARLIQKMERYCAYQERCHSDVQNKLKKLNVNWGIAQDVILHLMQENFLNEQRFATAYAEGKLRIKHWGKIKIRNGLVQKFVSKECIKMALASIDDEQYKEVFESRLEIARKRYENESDNYTRLQKIKRYMYSKGYEMELIGTID
jgi:regulatory protein